MNTALSALRNFSRALRLEGLIESKVSFGEENEWNIRSHHRIDIHWRMYLSVSRTNPKVMECLRPFATRATVVMQSAHVECQERTCSQPRPIVLPLSSRVSGWITPQGRRRTVAMIKTVRRLGVRVVSGFSSHIEETRPLPCGQACVYCIGHEEMDSQAGPDDCFNDEWAKYVERQYYLLPSIGFDRYRK